MWSQPAARDDRMVVSEIGEQWSPKQPPPITAAIAAYILQCRIGQWGTIVSPSETLTIDTTIYRRMQMEENIGIRSTGIGLRYSPIRERRQAMKETVTFTSLSSGLHYAHVREHPDELETEIVMIGSLTSGIEYKQTGESPV